jgi:hypothetical protein
MFMSTPYLDSTLATTTLKCFGVRASGVHVTRRPESQSLHRGFGPAARPISDRTTSVYPQEDAVYTLV